MLNIFPYHFLIKANCTGTIARSPKAQAGHSLCAQQLAVDANGTFALYKSNRISYTIFWWYT